MLEYNGFKALMLKNTDNSRKLFWTAKIITKDLVSKDFCSVFNKLFDRNYKPISIGGWCGPTAAIQEASLDPRTFPFDRLRTTFEGICRCFDNNFKDYFPERPWKPEKIAGYSTYRGRYTSFWHHDITKPETIKAFKRRIKRLTDLLKTTKKTIVFIRVVTDIDPKKEFSKLSSFNKIVKNRFPKLKYKFVFILHGQKYGTVQVQNIDNTTAVWCVSKSQDNKMPNIIDYHEGYKKIVNFVINKNNWPPTPAKILTNFKKGNDLWLVDGTCMVRVND